MFQKACPLWYLLLTSHDILPERISSKNCFYIIKETSSEQIVISGKKITAACKEKKEEEWGGWEGLLALPPYPSGVAWFARCWLQCPRGGNPWTRRFQDRGYHWQHRASWLCGPFPPPSAAGPCQWLGSQLGGGLLQEERTCKVKEKHSSLAMGYSCSDSSATVQHLCLCWKTAAWLPYWESYQVLKAH